MLPRFNISCDCQSTKAGSEWNSQFSTCECPAGTTENKQATRCERVSGQPGSDSRELGGESEFSDQEGGSDYGFGGDFEDYDEEPGLFGMFSGSVSSRVGWGVVALQCLLGVILWYLI